MQDPEKTGRGAGGKLRRQPPRRPPATPYARPQQNQSLRGRLLSKLVDPACRLIAGGATKIFPSFLSKQLSLPPPEPHTQVNLDGDIEEQEHANVEDQTFSSIIKFEDSKTTGTSGTSDGSKAAFDLAENLSDNQDDGLSEIEKLMKGKTFSRDEINRLIEILNSRAADAPKVDQESKDLSLSTGIAKGPIVSQDPGRPTEEKRDDLNKTVSDLATPLPKPTLLDETGSAPIEVAKAYMASRTLGLNLGSNSIISKEKRSRKLSDDFASEPFVPLSSPKPSTCWPGSMAEDQHGYLTPQSQRGRFGLHNIPRTLYSRTIHSKSKSKLAHVRDKGNGSLNGTFSPLQQSQSSLYGQLRSNIVDDGHGSVGPIRRIRHKDAAETPSRETIYSHSSLNSPLPVRNSNLSKGLLPSSKKNLEEGRTSSSLAFRSLDSNRSSGKGIPPVHPHSSQMARTILEHLERNLATPVEKSNELKIASSLKRSQSSDANTAVSDGHNSFPYLGLDSSKSKVQFNNKSPALLNEDRGNSFSVASPKITIKDKNVKETSFASDLKVNCKFTMLDNNAGSSLDFGKTENSQMKAADKVTDAAVSEGVQKHSSNSLGNKPVLASISVTKPEQRWMFTSDNSSGFTFPVSTSSGMLSEPPTPSIMPLLSGSSQLQPKEEHAGISYSFGSNRSSPPLVFSFPSTSTASSNHVEASDITFNFGSDRSSRISFSSVGKKYHMLLSTDK